MWVLVNRLWWLTAIPTWSTLLVGTGRAPSCSPLAKIRRFASSTHVTATLMRYFVLNRLVLSYLFTNNVVYYLGGHLPWRIESDTGHLPSQRSRVHDRLFENVWEAVLVAGAQPPERSNRHGRTGHVQRSHVPIIRRWHEHGLPLRKGEFNWKLLSCFIKYSFTDYVEILIDRAILLSGTLKSLPNRRSCTTSTRFRRPIRNVVLVWCQNEVVTWHLARLRDSSDSTIPDCVKSSQWPSPER